MPPSFVSTLYIDDKAYTTYDSALVYTKAHVYNLLSKYQPVKPGKTFLGLVDSDGNPLENTDESFTEEYYYTTWSYDPVWIDGEILHNIANAIRAKKDMSPGTFINVSEMAEQILSI